VHPTAVKLLDTAVELLETMSIDNIGIAEVLERSGVSHGSLYHHFEDFPDLVEQAAVRRFEAGLTESIAILSELLDATDAADFRRQAEQVVVGLHSVGRRPYRMDRLAILGASMGRPRLADRVSAAQREHLEQQGALFAEFQSRGWMRRDLDAMAMSTFTSSTYFGRTIDDVAGGVVDSDLWTEVAIRAIGAVLFDA
ncbi:MAG: hypothetical protein RLZZ01_253, partial [Actinomycetota bacterium]